MLPVLILAGLGALRSAAAPRSSPPPPARPPIDSFPTSIEKLVAAAAFGDLPALEELLAAGAEAELDLNAEPDYKTSAAVHHEIIPPGSPVSGATVICFAVPASLALCPPLSLCVRLSRSVSASLVLCPPLSLYAPTP